MQKVMAAQIAVELRSARGAGAGVQLTHELAAVRGATWLRVAGGDARSARVLVATIDAALDLAMLDVLSRALSTREGDDGSGDVAQRVAAFLAPRERERFCFACATSARWHGRFGRGGVVADEGHLVCGREARADVAGQHRLPAEAIGAVLVRRWV
jgi:hypothetical protein